MNGFDLLAPVYDRLVKTVFGDELLKATTVFFGTIKEGDKILIIGGGTGKILESIRCPKVEVTFVELSAGMIKRAKRRDYAGNVNFISGSYRDIPFEQYDIIITPFFLDLFVTRRVKHIIVSLKELLKNDGCWMVTDFVINNVLWQRILLWIMYRFFRITCRIEARELPEYEKEFSTSFKRMREEYYFHNMVLTAVYEKVSDKRN